MLFLYDYMTESELQEAKDNAVFENTSLHLDNEYKILCMEHAARLNDIETQVLLESFSEDDLTALYERENIVFMEGVKEWWEKFKEWVEGIVNALLEKKPVVPNEKPADEIEIPFNINEGETIIDKIIGAVKGKSFKKEDGKWDIGKIAVVGGTTILSLGGISAVCAKLKEKTKVKFEDAPSLWDRVTAKAKDIESIISNLGGEDNNFLSSVKELLSPLLKTVKDAANGIKSAIEKGGKAVENVANGAKEKIKEKIAKESTDDTTEGAGSLYQELALDEVETIEENAFDAEAFLESHTNEDIDELMALADLL